MPFEELISQVYRKGVIPLLITDSPNFFREETCSHSRGQPNGGEDWGDKAKEPALCNIVFNSLFTSRLITNVSCRRSHFKPSTYSALSSLPKISLT